MTQAPGKEQDTMEVAQAQEGDGKDNKDIQKSDRLTPFLTTVPRSVTRFKKLPVEKTPDSSSPPEISGPQYSGPLEGPFGLGPLVFPVFQRFNNIDFFLFLFFVVVVADGFIFAHVDQSYKILEEEFSLTDTEKYLMDYSDYYVSFMVAIFVAYYGGRGNRSRWMAASAFILGITSVVFAIPFYKYEIIRQFEDEEDLCEVTNATDCGTSRIPHRSICIYLFIFAQCLHGMTAMPFYILGFTFIYEHTPKLSTGIYIAIADSVQVLGYALGLAVGAVGARSSQNQALNGDANVHNFRQWQKVWWSGFISVAVVSWCTFPLFLCFPPRLPGGNKLIREKEKEHLFFDKRLENKEFGHSLKDLLQAVKCLVSNPLVMCFSLCKTSECLTLKGNLKFVPIYLESRFLMTPTLASRLTALFMFFGYTVGRFLGGLIVDRLEMSFKNKIRFIVLTSFVSVCLFILILSVECETAKFAGITEDYDGTGILGNLTAPCNEKCDCPNKHYASLCGRNDKEYFSACYAGCTAYKYFQGEKTYYNCSCIKEGLTTSDSDGHFIDGTSGKCSTRCDSLPLFFAFFFSSIVFANLSTVSVNLSILQSAPISYNSLSMGVTFTIWRLIGSVGLPEIFKKVSIKSCIYWNINNCGLRGRCWIYDVSKVVYMMMGISIIFQASLTFFSLLALFNYNRGVKKNTENMVKKANASKQEKT
ncbi:solute carrier organic anion transporter family member 6A1-like [Microtus ochrogaster]|uniref:Solute carrier organic anion transporter family member 6A1-like n=1 Tax=Microtus ochrogaster TaxID=79684 RepID=A0ABM0L938_MICOH|nr:solute carrier organic anion transporter family member 6A1-like [Microtus ochrogaster]